MTTGSFSAAHLNALSTALAGRYQLERELGAGGMATVWLAHDLRNERPVAIKVLHPELSTVLGPERFLAEIRTTANLQHPHILPLFDSGRAEGLLYYVMPFVEGESLRARLERDGQLPVPDAVRIAAEVADALDYAHRHGVIHRDIKPENILLHDGHVVVADFGIALALAQADGPRMTQTGLSLGTPQYMAPEQLWGERRLDPRADQYALAVTCFELLTGRTPLDARPPSAAGVPWAAQAPSARVYRRDVPPAMDAALRRAMALDPEARFPSITMFAQALGAGQHVSGRRPRTVVVVTALLAVSMVVGLTMLLSHRGAVRAAAAPVDATHTATLLRVAVLPFDNLGDSTRGYFADGVSDALRARLAEIPGLVVIARGSSLQFRGAGTSLRDAARALGVRYLLTGTVRWAPAGTGSRVQVSPELVEVDSSSGAPTSRGLGAYDGALDDVFQVQADIAAQVASALGVALAMPDSTGHAPRPTRRLDAYDAFLRAEAASGSMGASDPAALRRASTAYEQAVALDTGFALAWAQLGRTRALLYWISGTGAADAELAESAARRAAELAPGLPQAHLALGDYDALVRGDASAALVEYQRALGGADRAAVFVAMAYAERMLGRWDDAVAHLRAAQAIDPRSVVAASQLTEDLLWLRRHDEAEAVVRAARMVAPGNVQLAEQEAMIALARGDLPRARATVAEVSARTGRPDEVVAYFGMWWDLVWVPDAAGQERLARLGPSAFGGDRRLWASTLAQLAAARGDLRRMRAYADSARQASAADATTPYAAMMQAFTLALRGDHAAAIALGERSIAALPRERNAYDNAYMRQVLARIYLMAGAKDRARAVLAALLRDPFYLTPAWLRVDPAFAALRDDPALSATHH